MSPQGVLIYLTMAAYFAAFVLLRARQRRIGMAAFALGFVAALFSVACRGWRVAHLPMQNLFEVFLCLGALMYPLAVMSRRWLAVGGEATDALLGCILLFPAGVVFPDTPQPLPDALQSLLFGPHVGSYLLAYVVMAKAGVHAAAHLVSGDRAPEPGLATREEATHRLALLTAAATKEASATEDTSLLEAIAHLLSEAALTNPSVTVDEDETRVFVVLHQARQL